MTRFPKKIRLMNRGGNATTTPSMLWRLLVGTLLWVSCCVSSQGRTVSDNELNFSLTVPDRYIQLASSGDTVYSFATSDPAAGVPEAVIAVQRMHGVIGPEPLDLAATGISDAHFLNEKWKTFDIDGFAGHLTKNGIQFAARAVQIPLQREAVQIIVVVPIEREAIADGVLREFLAGLDGPSNWPIKPELSPYERGRLLGQGVVRLAVTIALLAAVTVAVVRYFRRPKNGRTIKKER
jgi:hypothetical protein